jgi:hypothetical protein
MGDYLYIGYAVCAGIYGSTALIAMLYLLVITLLPRSMVYPDKTDKSTDAPLQIKVVAPTPAKTILKPTKSSSGLFGRYNTKRRNDGL